MLRYTNRNPSRNNLRGDYWLQCTVLLFTAMQRLHTPLHVHTAQQCFDWIAVCIECSALHCTTTFVSAWLPTSSFSASTDNWGVTLNHLSSHFALHSPFVLISDDDHQKCQACHFKVYFLHNWVELTLALQIHEDLSDSLYHRIYSFYQIRPFHLEFHRYWQW